MRIYNLLANIKEIKANFNCLINVLHLWEYFLNIKWNDDVILSSPPFYFNKLWTLMQHLKQKSNKQRADLKRMFFDLFISLGAALSPTISKQQRRWNAEEETYKVLCDCATAVWKIPNQAEAHSDGKTPQIHLLPFTAGSLRRRRVWLWVDTCWVK